MGLICKFGRVSWAGLQGWTQNLNARAWDKGCWRSLQDSVKAFCVPRSWHLDRSMNQTRKARLQNCFAMQSSKITQTAGAGSVSERKARARFCDPYVLYRDAEAVTRSLPRNHARTNHCTASTVSIAIVASSMNLSPACFTSICRFIHAPINNYPWLFQIDNKDK